MKNIRSILFGLSAIIIVSLVNKAQARAAQLSLDELSENNMFNSHDQKQVMFLDTLGPTPGMKSIGQIGGIDTDADGKLIVFHRGSRRWGFDSFFPDNSFNTNKYGAIPEKVLSLVDVKHRKVIDSWGEDKFYMPHGLTVDHEGNIWLTDVALHQVFKYSFAESDEPRLILGVAFKSGSDENHLCKPTDVEVARATGHVFVADGYCNQRVACFDKNGNFMREYKDEQSPLQVAHSVTLVESLNLVCTVSRQEGRIVCFDIESGEKTHELRDPDMHTVYAIKYDAVNHVLHAVTGENSGAEAIGLTFDASKRGFGRLLQKWNGQNRDLKETHDFTMAHRGSLVYLAQLNGEIDEFTFQ